MCTYHKHTSTMCKTTKKVFNLVHVPGTGTADFARSTAGGAGNYNVPNYLYVSYGANDFLHRFLHLFYYDILCSSTSASSNVGLAFGSLCQHLFINSTNFTGVSTKSFSSIGGRSPAFTAVSI